MSTEKAPLGSETSAEGHVLSSNLPINTDELYYVRIPERFFDMLRWNELTGALFLTMSLLYRLSDWKTGKVKFTSAAGLRTLSGNAYSVRTFSESLRILEAMGEITRIMQKGNHHSYPVTIHNYRVVAGDGQVKIVNPKETVSYRSVLG